MKQDITYYKDMLDVLTQDMANNIYKSGWDAIGSFAEGDQKMMLCDALTTLTKTNSINVKEARRRIANKLIDDEVYKF